MALSQTIRAFSWGDGETMAAQDLRLGTISAQASALRQIAGSAGALAAGSGVRPAGANPLSVSATSGLNIGIQPGIATIQGTAAANSGAYTVIADSAANLTVAAADTVNPRIDLVCLTVVDVGSGSSYAEVQIVTGTPAALPSAPATPSNSLALAQVTVPANATVLTGGDISDQRAYCAAVGGITVVQNSTYYPTAGPDGAYLHDLSTGRLRRFKASGGTTVAAATVAFAPVYATPGSATANSTTFVTVASATVTVDGVTDVEIPVSWKRITTTGTSAGNGMTMQMLRGSAGVTSGAIVKYAQATNGPIDGGGVFFYDRAPANGTYTYSLQIANEGTGSFALDTGAFALMAMPA